MQPSVRLADVVEESATAKVASVANYPMDAWKALSHAMDPLWGDEQGAQLVVELLKVRCFPPCFDMSNCYCYTGCSALLFACLQLLYCPTDGGGSHEVPSVAFSVPSIHKCLGTLNVKKHASLAVPSVAPLAISACDTLLLSWRDVTVAKH